VNVKDNFIMDIEIDPHGFKKVYDRELSHLTQTEICVLLDGIITDRSTVAKWLKDISKVPLHRLRQVAERLEIPVADFFKNQKKTGGTLQLLGIDNLESVLQEFPELKYALMYAGDQNTSELERTIVAWAKKIKNESESKQTGVAERRVATP